MSQDVKLFHQCDHFTGGRQYTIEHCPKCLSKGYYYDISFDATGKAVTVGGTIKLQQEVLKAMHDIRGDNIFFPNYGSGIHDFIGRKATVTDTMKMDYDLRRTLEYLRQLQNLAARTYGNMSDDEVIKDVDSVDIQRFLTGYAVSVKFSNVSNETYDQQIEL